MARALTPAEERSITEAVRVIRETTELLRVGTRGVASALAVAQDSPRGRVAARQSVDDQIGRQSAAFTRILESADQITAALAAANR